MENNIKTETNEDSIDEILKNYPQKERLDDLDIEYYLDTVNGGGE